MPRVGDRVELDCRKGVRSAVVVRVKAPDHVQVRFTLKDGSTAESWKVYPDDFVRSVSA
jgi:hypothetical protein